MLSIAQLKKRLADGVYDRRLAHVYCKPESEISGHVRRLERCLSAYCEVFGAEETAEVAVFSAPGRTELGGNHTDHQRGIVLTGSVDLDAIAVAAPNGTERIRIFSEGYGLIEMDGRELEKMTEEENTTPALIRGIVAAITAKGYPVSGFNAYITSDVPGGSGLSSSACFEVLIGVAVNGLFCGGALSLPEIAKIGQYAENVYFGKPSGLLDQMGCAMGGMISINFYDKENPAWKVMDFDFAATGYALCIIDTGADHADLTPDYSAMPAEMKAVAAYFGAEVLSQVEKETVMANIPALRKQLGDRAVLRAIHYYDECDRARSMAQALDGQDFAGYLKLVDASGRSSWTYLQNVSTGRDPGDQPVALTIAVAEQLLGGRGVVRVHGGGFAGTIQAYVPQAMTEQFCAEMDAFLFPGACRVTSIRPEGGCELIGGDD